MADGSSPLFECWRKLERGKEHLKALNSGIDAFLKSNPYQPVLHYDTKAARYLVKFAAERPLPQTEWVLIIGDCVHNLRTSLDYMAWRLAGSDRTDRDTMFIICKTPDAFKSREWRLKRLSDEAFAFVDGLQPYQRSNPKLNRLWVLEELDIGDKHKLLATTQAVHEGAHITCDDPFPLTIPFVNVGKFGPDTIISELITPFREKMEVQFHGSFDIVFDKGVLEVGAIRVRGSLEELAEAIDRILVEAERRIETVPGFSK
jgi:hypothetical protein